MDKRTQAQIKLLGAQLHCEEGICHAAANRSKAP